MVLILKIIFLKTDQGIFIQMKTQYLKSRVSSVRRELKKNKVTCLIVTNPSNVTYLTGFSGHDSWAIVTPAKVFLITDSRYTEQARNDCPHAEIVERSGPITKAIADLIKKQASQVKIAIEDSASVAVYEKLKQKLKRSIKTTSGIIESVRTLKDSEEVSLIKKAAQIAAAALKQSLVCLKTGVTENAFAGLIEFNIRKAGAAISFETIVAFGPNASRPHHQPGNRKLRKTDTVLIDFGVKYKNYCCDITRCFMIGKPDPLYR
ncbi:MAG: aminopeptidase P family protein, partial [Candidatus Brocadiia bacterium]